MFSAILPCYLRMGFHPLINVQMMLMVMRCLFICFQCYCYFWTVLVKMRIFHIDVRQEILLGIAHKFTYKSEFSWQSKWYNDTVNFYKDIHFKILCMMYKFLNHLASPYLNELRTPYSKLQGLRSNNFNFILVLHTLTCRYRHCGKWGNAHGWGVNIWFSLQCGTDSDHVTFIF